MKPWIPLAALLLMGASKLEAQIESGSEASKDATAAVLNHFERFRVTVVGSDVPMTPVPAIFWGNETRDPTRGKKGKCVTVLLVQDGHPLAACCIYPPMPASYLTHEFGSLTSEERIRVELDGRSVWTSQTRGVDFQPIPGAPVPSSSAAGRMRQMKLMARQFDVDILWRNVQTEVLRLLPQPFYRYEVEDDSNIVDGAVFCFAMSGVDPEALLLLEARPAQAPKSEAKWHFAFARRTSAKITARHSKESGTPKTVWQVPQINSRDKEGTFIQIGVRSKPE